MRFESFKEFIKIRIDQEPNEDDDPRLFMEEEFDGERDMKRKESCNSHKNREMLQISWTKKVISRCIFEL